MTPRSRANIASTKTVKPIHKAGEPMLSIPKEVSRPLRPSGDLLVATSAHTGQPAERELASLRTRRGTVSRVPTSANNALCKKSRTLSREPDRSRRRRRQSVDEFVGELAAHKLDLV